MDDSQRLSVTEKIGYSLGDCAANFVFQTQIMFLLGFYTDVLGISAGVAGWIFLYSRLFDAVNDPLMGGVADRTTSRWGKYRPWVLFTAIPFAILFFLTYSAPEFIGGPVPSATGEVVASAGSDGASAEKDPWAKVLWAVVTYNALMMIYTANNIPYSALTGVMTGNQVERASLVQWRFVLAMVAQFFVQGYTLYLVDFFGQGNKATGFQLTIALWATIAVTFFLITFATTRERVTPPPGQKTSISADIGDLLRNRNWVLLAIATVFIFVCLSLRGGITYFYFQYFVGDGAFFGNVMSSEALFGYFNGLGTLATIVGILFSKPLALRFGKRDVFRCALLATALSMAAFVLLPSSAVDAMIGLQMLLQFVYGLTIPLLWSMMADVADFSEWKLGRRATAMTFAATVFALKLGLSIGGAVNGWLLEAYGYVPNVEIQTEQTLEGIRLMMSVFPAVSFVAAIIVLSFYSINRSTEEQMTTELEQRRAAYVEK
jgi:GPH family glycoside/pentoside/hexuronide:cation symporter